jgi:sugar lactone lactonase YvrE
MRYVKGLALAFGAVIVIAGGRAAVHVSAQDVAPTNSLPNPYDTVEGWAKMPEGRTWGSTSAVDIDKDGKTIWVAERCGANSCAGSTLDPVLHFDENGKLIKSFGSGLIVAPHGIFVDKDDNIWVTDCACTGGGGRGRAGEAPAAPAEPKGHQIFKFDRNGKLLMTLGKAGGGKEPDFFFMPNDVVVAPNGDIIVSEGHGGENSRLLRLDKTGKLIRSFGKKGSGKDEFDQPHALAYDSRGRLFVGDRGNNRILIYDDKFNQLAEWKQFSRPSGIYIDKNDTLYVADSESGSVSRDQNRQLTRKEWKRGIRIGSAKDGTVRALVPDPAENPPSTSAAEGVAVDAAGHIYGAEVGPKALKRYVKK